MEKRLQIKKYRVTYSKRGEFPRKIHTEIMDGRCRHEVLYKLRYDEGCAVYQVKRVG